MRLKRLEMVGFKSFADATVVELNPGITAIVGPNGCGKSNIVDAIIGLSTHNRQEVLASRGKPLDYINIGPMFPTATKEHARYGALGTDRVLDLCRNLPGLQRLQYVSTCYVSGRYDGEFTEDMLEEGQPFRNHYESTKYEAELLAPAEPAPVTPPTPTGSLPLSHAPQTIDT